MKKYDHSLTHLPHSELYWLDVADRVTYKLGVTVYKARHRIICLSCAHWSLKLLNDSIFLPPATIYSLFHGFSSMHTAVAPSLSLDQRHGTCSKTICVSRTCKLTVFIVKVKSSQVAFNKQVTIAPVLQKLRIKHS